MNNKKQFQKIMIEIIKIDNDEIITTSGEERLIDSLFGEGKDGVDVG